MLISNSKLVHEGDTFIALKGSKYDGHDFIDEAINNGASKLIVEHGVYDVETLQVVDTKEYLHDYLKNNHVDIKVIGVTGTNGKTTTCFLIYQLLNKLNVKCAYIGTIGYYVEDNVEELDNTTPSSLELYNLFKRSKDLGCQVIVMETSSQALDQGRCDYIDFDYGIFTNLTQDHLDYHGNLDAYVLAKQKLFNRIKPDGIGIVNIDDPYSSYFKINNYVTYGFNDSDYKIEMDDDFKINNDVYKFKLIGKHNVYNMASAIVLLNQFGFTYDDIFNDVYTSNSPTGRMECITSNTNRIIIDYAHTPDAVLNVINAVKEIEHNKIIVLIGCGGNRDKTKRPIMGSIATRNADYVIFTNDNPRFEKDTEIIKDIISGVDTNNYEIELNREFAIKKGIQLLSKNDILLVLGKGHEKYQIINDQKLYFDDRKIVIDNIN